MSMHSHKNYYKNHNLIILIFHNTKKHTENKLVNVDSVFEALFYFKSQCISVPYLEIRNGTGQLKFNIKLCIAKTQNFLWK